MFLPHVGIYWECFLIHLLNFAVQGNSRSDRYRRFGQFKSPQLWNIDQKRVHRGSWQLHGSSSQRREKGQNIRGFNMICIITIFLFVTHFFFLTLRIPKQRYKKSHFSSAQGDQDETAPLISFVLVNFFLLQLHCAFFFFLNYLDGKSCRCPPKFSL